MEELNSRVKHLKSQVETSIEKLGLAKLRQDYDQVQQQMAKPGFWDNQKQAQEVSRQASAWLTQLEPWESLQGQLDEAYELIETNDPALAPDLKAQLELLETRYDDLKKDLRFNGPYDGHDVILNIYAGAGGTDAQDWVQMLLRMYSRWADSEGLRKEIIEQSPGDEAGLKSATLKLSGGQFLYGKLAGEHGVHRLVRKSPFNSAGSRETSFAKVDVLPLVDKPGEVELNDKDLKVDVFRSGGPGGQSVNTTDSAVRVTHLPTGISVVIQNERSQLQNKETAMSLLRSRLVALQLEQHAETLADLKGPNRAVEFGSQIRNYILDDRIVKDLRSGYETHDPQKVLDGDLNPLIEAYFE